MNILFFLKVHSVTYQTHQKMLPELRSILKNIVEIDLKELKLNMWKLDPFCIFLKKILIEFLIADTRLYKALCWLVRWVVGPSVRP